MSLHEFEGLAEAIGALSGGVGALFSVLAFTAARGAKMLARLAADRTKAGRHVQGKWVESTVAEMAAESVTASEATRHEMSHLRGEFLVSATGPQPVPLGGAARRRQATSPVRLPASESQYIGERNSDE